MKVKPIYITAGLFTLFGLFIILESIKLPYWSEFGPGPGFLPLWIGICLTLLSFFLFIQLLRSKAIESSERPFFVSWSASRRVWLIILAYCGLGVLIRWLGFHVLSALFVIFSIGFVEKRRWWMSVVIGVLTALGFYVVFDVLMKSDLPKGLLWG